MESDPFVALISRLSPRLTRRRLGLLGALGVAGAGGVTGVDARKKKRRKKKKTCKSCPVCQQCVKGACAPQADGTGCGSGGHVCTAGQCGCPQGKADSDGVCATPPVCSAFFTECAGDSACCSGICLEAQDPRICFKGEAGKPCHNAADCSSGLRCVGFVCTA